MLRLGPLLPSVGVLQGRHVKWFCSPRSSKFNANPSEIALQYTTETFLDGVLPYSIANLHYYSALSQVSGSNYPGQERPLGTFELRIMLGKAIGKLCEILLVEEAYNEPFTAERSFAWEVLGDSVAGNEVLPPTYDNIVRLDYHVDYNYN